MAANSNLILAGVAGQGGTPSLAWFAPAGSTAPADASTALDAAFKDGGWCDQSGITVNNATSTTDIAGFGSYNAVRTLTQKVDQTAKVIFLETNLVSLAIYNSLPLTGSGAPTLTALTGAINVTTGAARTQKYSAVFDTTDGLNKIRIYCPLVQVTNHDPLTVSQGAPVQYGVEIKTYPDSTGNSAYFFYILDALKTP